MTKGRFVDADMVLNAFAGAPAIDPDRWRADMDAHVDDRIDPHT